MEKVKLWRKGSFNPCSLGCCSESKLCSWIWQGLHVVSILVLLDVALKVTTDDLIVLADEFQSLFSWMLLWKAAIRWCTVRCTSVSILVLLDVALKVYVLPFQKRENTCFNPCSLGCCSESMNNGMDGDNWSCFNPCSLGCCSERVAGSKQLKCGNHYRFNPCSLGCCSERGWGERRRGL